MQERLGWGRAANKSFMLLERDMGEDDEWRE